jgi:hypothetical protein
MRPIPVRGPGGSADEKVGVRRAAAQGVGSKEGAHRTRIRVHRDEVATTVRMIEVLLWASAASDLQSLFLQPGSAPNDRL